MRIARGLTPKCARHAREHHSGSAKPRARDRRHAEVGGEQQLACGPSSCLIAASPAGPTGFEPSDTVRWLTDVTPDRAPRFFRPGSHRQISAWAEQDPARQERRGRELVDLPALQYAERCPSWRARVR